MRRERQPVDLGAPPKQKQLQSGFSVEQMIRELGNEQSAVNAEFSQFFNQIGATKELLLSKYCPSYLGFDDMTDADFNQYFFEIKKGKSLKKLLSEAGKTLVD